MLREFITMKDSRRSKDDPGFCGCKADQLTAFFLDQVR